MPVYESYLPPKSGHALVCPRIKVKVLSSKNVHYLRNKNHGFHDIFDIFPISQALGSSLAIIEVIYLIFSGV